MQQNMEDVMKRKIWLTCFGGCAYILLEIIWNGRSHWSMFILGGICFRMISLIRKFKVNLPIKCVLCGLGITVAEFFSGVILNIILKWHIWDYSFLPFNVLGQVCLPFTLLWTLISWPAIKIDEMLENKMNFAKKQNKFI